MLGKADRTDVRYDNDHKRKFLVSYVEEMPGEGAKVGEIKWHI